MSYPGELERRVLSHVANIVVEHQTEHGEHRCYHIPTLRQTLELCEGRIGLFLEIKSLSSFNRFAQIIRHYRFRPDKICLISFEKETLIRVLEVLPEFKRGFLSTGSVSDIKIILQQIHTEFVGIEYRQLTSEFVQQAKRVKASIFVWNVPNKQAFKETLAFGVTGIITDDAQKIQRWLL